MKNTNRESGQTLIMVALSSMVLLGFMAFATDVGVLLHAKKQMQSAADSAALAGAYQLSITGSYSSARQEGMADAAKNGFSSASNCPGTPNSSGPTVCIKEPTNDSHAAFNAFGYVEADISAPTPTPFINAFWTWFNPGYTPLTVSARAVAVSAGGGGLNPTCGTIMSNQTSGSAMTLQGSFTADFPGCTFDINSSSPDALDITGAGGSIIDCASGGTGCGSINVVGGVKGQVGKVSDVTPNTGVSQFSDPLGNRDLSAELPNLTSSCGPAPANINSAGFTPAWRTITPAAGQTDPLTGTASTPPQPFPAYNAVCYSGNVTLTSASLPAGGVYVFTGNVTLNGVTSPQVTAQSPAGVTLVIANSGSLTVAPGANEQVNLSAPLLNTTTNADDDLWNGVLIYQSNSNTINAQVGSSSALFQGIIYAPTAEFFLQDSGGDKNGGVQLQTELIVGTLNDKTATMQMSCYICNQEGSGAGVFPRVTLVE